MVYGKGCGRPVSAQTQVSNMTGTGAGEFHLGYLSYKMLIPVQITSDTDGAPEHYQGPLQSTKARIDPEHGGV